MKRFYNLFFVLAFILTSNISIGQNATFIFNNTGTNATIDNAINYTGSIWSNYLNSTVPIKVNVIYIAMGPGTTLAITLPNGEKDFANAPLDSIWYPSCLANSLDSTEINVGEADMDIWVNSDEAWYFGTDGNTPFNKHDFVSVLLHEIGHGLGFLSVSKVEFSSQIGSFGYLTAQDIFPLTTTFPFDSLEGLPSVWDHWLINGSNQALTDTSIFANPSSALTTAFTSNDVWFSGPLAFVENGGSNVKVFAPGPSYLNGSSMNHLDEGTYPANDPNTLMTPYIGQGETNHEPGFLTIAILEDIGWNVNYWVGIENKDPLNTMMTYPNPFYQSFAVMLPGHLDPGSRISITDINGKIIVDQEISLTELNEKRVLFNEKDTDSMVSGIYLCKVTSDENTFYSKVIRQNN